MSDYKHENGRIVPRDKRGRFKATTLEDLGVPSGHVADGPLECEGCGHTWHPVLKTASCPECGRSAWVQCDNCGGDGLAECGPFVARCEECEGGLVAVVD